MPFHCFEYYWSVGCCWSWWSCWSCWSCLSVFVPHIIVWGSYFWGCSRRRPTTDRRPTDDRPTTDRRPTDRPTAPPLSFFYTHTRHTHVDSLTHTRQTHTRSLTVPFAHGARAGASLDTHTVDAHTFAHGARARLTLDTHSTLQALTHTRSLTVPERVSH